MNYITKKLHRIIAKIFISMLVLIRDCRETWMLLQI